MQEIRFKRKTPLAELQAHFACGTSVALTICHSVLQMEKELHESQSFSKTRDLHYPGTHGLCPYDLLMSTILFGCDEAIQFYAEHRFPEYGENALHQLDVMVGKNYADTGYKRNHYPYTEAQQYVLNQLFGEMKMNFRNTGYMWRMMEQEDKVGFWCDLLQKRNTHTEKTIDELEQFQVQFAKEFFSAMKQCDCLPQTLEEVPTFLLRNDVLKISGTEISLNIPDAHNKQVDRHMKTCRDLFVWEFDTKISGQTQDGMRVMFYHAFPVTEQELANVNKWLETHEIHS